MTDTPDLEIAQDVLFGIAQLALDRVDGIRSVAPPTRVGEILGGRRAKGIQIQRDGSDLTVDLIVAVDYGAEIPVVARQAQREIREAVASMTGLVVRSVNVTVDSIDLPADVARG